MSKKILKKSAAVIVLVALNMGVLNVSKTNAYYNDTENSTGNIFATGLLDFRLTNNNLEKMIGPEALGEISHASVAMPESGSLAMQYILNTSIATTSNSVFCNELTVEAKDNGITKYNGPLSGLRNATTTEFGTWEFRFDLPPNISVPHRVKCDASTTFSAWRADIADPALSGWHDEETLNISFTARMVVLNEIFPHPFAAAATPKDREYIELYNNGSTPVDVLGWKISEISGSTEKFYTIVPSATSTSQMQPFGSGTIIPANGFLTLVFKTAGATNLNNDGDTVKLYDDSNTLLDAHTYPNTVAGKSHVRYPDGIGYWVDPEPTPGEINQIKESDLLAAGLDETTIAEILKLAILRSVPMPQVDILQSLVDNNSTTTIAAEVATTTENIATTSITADPVVLAEATSTMTIVDLMVATTTTTNATSTSEALPPFKEEEVVESVVAPEPAVVPSEPVIIPEPIIEPVPTVVETPATEPPPTE